MQKCMILLTQYYLYLLNQSFCLSLFVFSTETWKVKGDEDLEDIKRNPMTEIHIISKEEFHQCFDLQKTHWNKCVKWLGDYFGKN